MENKVNISSHQQQFDQSLTSNDSNDDQHQVKELKEIDSIFKTKKMEDELSKLEIQLKKEELESKIEELKKKIHKIDNKNTIKDEQTHQYQNSNNDQTFINYQKEMNQSGPNHQFPNIINQSKFNHITEQNIYDIFINGRKLSQEECQNVLFKNNNNMNNGYHPIKAPEINLPMFYGNIKEYRQFKETFLSIINRTNATLIEKFTHLKSKLCGEALNEIGTLSVTDGNYQVAWNILDKRFNNKRWLIEENVNSIFNAVPTEEKNAASIIKFKNIYTTAMHNLADLKVETASEILMVFIMKKIDSYTKCRFEDSLNSASDLPTFFELDTFLEKEYAVNVIKNQHVQINPTQIGELSNNYNNNHENVHYPNNFVNHYQNVQYSNNFENHNQNVQYSNNFENHNQNVQYPNNHENNQYPVNNQKQYVNYEIQENQRYNPQQFSNQHNSSYEKKNKFSNQRHPYWKNKQNYSRHHNFKNNINNQKNIWFGVANKPGKEICLICNEIHATILCPAFIASKNKTKLLMRLKICNYCVKHKYDSNIKCYVREFLKCKHCGGRHISEMHCHLQQSTSINLTENQSDEVSEILLPTAIANIVGSNNELTPLRCLIDQGSQSSYITEDAVQKLKLNKKKTKVQLVGVGGNVINRSDWSVTILIKFDNPNLPILKTKALVLNTITNKMPTQNYQISGIDKAKQLADPKFYKSSHISIMLGSNVLPHIILNGAKTKNGLLYQNTKLGWIVSGGRSTEIGSLISTQVNFSEVQQGIGSYCEMSIQEDSTNDEINSCEKLSVEKFTDMGHLSSIQKKPQGNKSGEDYYIPYLSKLRKIAVGTKLRKKVT